VTHAKKDKASSIVTKGKPKGKGSYKGGSAGRKNMTDQDLKGLLFGSAQSYSGLHRHDQFD
jgi:hypothetical protein